MVSRHRDAEKQVADGPLQNRDVLRKQVGAGSVLPRNQTSCTPRNRKTSRPAQTVYDCLCRVGSAPESKQDFSLEKRLKQAGRSQSASRYFRWLFDPKVLHKPDGRYRVEGCREDSWMCWKSAGVRGDERTQRRPGLDGGS